MLILGPPIIFLKFLDKLTALTDDQLLHILVCSALNFGLCVDSLLGNVGVLAQPRLVFVEH
jgi:hypothetical protein